MRQSSLRKTTFLSLLGISSAQTSSWGEPFSVAPAAGTSTDSLLPAAPTTSSWGDVFTVDNSAVTTPASSFPTSDIGSPSLIVDTASSVPSSVATTDVTLISGIQSAVPSRSATFNASASVGSNSSGSASTSTESTSGTSSVGSSTESATSGSAISDATGAAVPARGFKKMGFAGAIAGAAGVMFV